MMEKFKVFGKTADIGGNLMAIAEAPENQLDSGIPVTVFVESSETADAYFRFFYPDSLEAPICGHALLGAASHIDKSLFRVETDIGLYPIEKRNDGLVFACFGSHQQIAPNFDERPEATWFGLEPDEMKIEGVFSGSKPKLCISVVNRAVLNRVSCDLGALARWNKGKNFSGYVVYTEVEDGLVYARAMNPMYNISEDAACAVCSAALPIASDSFRVVMGFPDFVNEIQVEKREGEIWLGGRVFHTD